MPYSKEEVKQLQQKITTLEEELATEQKKSSGLNDQCKRVGVFISFCPSLSHLFEMQSLAQMYVPEPHE